MPSSLARLHLLTKQVLEFKHVPCRLLNTSSTVPGKHEASLYVKLRRRTRAKVLRESYNETDRATDRTEAANLNRSKRDTKTQSKHDNFIDSREILYGIHPIQAALHAGRRGIDSSSTLYMKIALYKRLFRESFTDNQIQLSDFNERILDIMDKVKEKQVQVLPVKNSKLDRLSQYAVHQGLCLNTKPLILDTLRSVESFDGRDRGNQVLVYIDSVKDPMNLGGILRSCSYFGVESVLLSSRCCPITAVVSKASAGAAEFMRLYKVNNDVKIVQDFISMGWKVVSSTCETEKSETIHTALSDMQNTDRVMIIVGNEGSGINEDLTDISTHQVCINSCKMTPITLDSLNVSVASGVILYEICNKMK